MFRVQHFHGNAAVRVVRKRLGQAVVISGRHHKAGVHQPQGRKDFLLQKRTQGLATDDLDQAPQHVGGAAVSPHVARLELQRDGGQRAGKLGVAAVAGGDFDFAVLALHRRVAQEFIGQPCGVAQQVLHRGGLRGGDQAARGMHLLVRKFRQVLADRVAQQQLPALHQHHHGD